MSKMIYLDYASHTPPTSEVLTAFCKTEEEFIANPMANHSLGFVANNKLNEVTKGLAEILNCKPLELIYTSGASESNNLAIKGICKTYKHIGRHILSTCLEHPSVSGTLANLQQEGYEIELVKILPNGQIDLNHLQQAIRPDTVLVCISAVDSELGVIQPLEEIGQIVSMYANCKLHIDAAQVIGKIPVKIDKFSTLSLSGHKFYGLTGIGVLIKKEGVVLEPLIHGGASTTIYRSGTPALGLAVACFTALQQCVNNMDTNLLQVQNMQNYLQSSLQAYPKVCINSPLNNSPYILNISVEGVKATEFQQKLSEKGVCVSVKSACSTDNSPSRPVMAISNKKNAMSSWRISLSHLTTQAEIDQFLTVFSNIYQEIT